MRWLGDNGHQFRVESATSSRPLFPQEKVGESSYKIRSLRNSAVLKRKSAAVFRNSSPFAALVLLFFPRGLERVGGPVFPFVLAAFISSCSEPERDEIAMMQSCADTATPEQPVLEHLISP